MPASGDLLAGRYRILERLGAGGSATVHRAHDERLDRDVAVKILLPNLADESATAARFEAEARSLAAASHPHVVAVYDVDPGSADEGREPFYVMELCPGGSFADRVAAGRIDPADAIPVVVSVADGLAELHRRGIVHRDVKPHNILFATEGPKIADFGLAQGDRSGISDLTAQGTAVGTLAYLAPEVVAGQRATPAADVYALGVVAFVALTGSWPRAGSSMADLVASSHEPALVASVVAPELGPAFDAALGSALAIDPGDRPDALELSAALTTALGRWARDGGPARSIAAAAARSIPAPGWAQLPARPAANAPGEVDATTAMAIATSATAAFPVPAPTGGAPRSDRRSRARRRSRDRILGIYGALVVAAAVVFLGWRLVDGQNPQAGVQASIDPAALSPSPSPSAAPSASEAPSRSVAPSPSLTPSPAPPTVDPAIAAVDAMDAAISGARGGPDGLKGKESNDLQDLVAKVRSDLANGNLDKARSDARALDRRIRDLGDKIDHEIAARLADASRTLLQALGG